MYEASQDTPLRDVPNVRWFGRADGSCIRLLRALRGIHLRSELALVLFLGVGLA